MSIAYDRTTPHRFDVVGSFLRPERLHEAHHAWKEGRLGADELRHIEDECIEELIRKEKEAGLGVLTDGEFRRETWHLDFMWSFAGIAHKPTETGLPFHDEAAKIDDTYLVDRIAYKGSHPFIDHFRFVQAREDGRTVAKLTIPAPAQFFEQFAMPFNAEATDRIYPDHAALADDIVAGYAAFIDDLYAAGCRNLQLDDCSWGMVVDPHAEQFFGVDAAGLEQVKEDLLDVNNRVLAGVPSDLVVNTHICRGNFHSTWACQGGYDGVADFLLARENVHAFFLEYDDERSGSFEPLAKVPDGKIVVLGLVTTKRPGLEDRASVIRRIHEAAQYVPLSRLCLSPQCGFASCDCGNKLTEDEQWAKVALVRSVAEEVWG